MYKFRLVVVFMCFSVLGFSQSEKKTDNKVEIDIVKVYTQVVNEGYGNAQIYKELANACYFKSQYAESKKWFEMLFEEEKTTDETLLYRYKQSLKALGIYDKNNTYLAVSGTN